MIGQGKVDPPPQKDHESLTLCVQPVNAAESLERIRMDAKCHSRLDRETRRIVLAPKSRVPDSRFRGNDRRLMWVSPPILTRLIYLSYASLPADMLHKKTGNFTDWLCITQGYNGFGFLLSQPGIFHATDEVGGR